jgi:two-component system LytT family response regulator
MRETMVGIEQKLPPETFARISRSVIINVDRVRELQPTFGGEYKVTLLDGTNLTLSRRYRRKLPHLGVG